MLPTSINLQTTLASLPPVYASSSILRRQIRSRIHENKDTPLLIALDDDPTGTQTCHDISVLTTWTITILMQEFNETPRGSGFFILTNTRALHPAATNTLIEEICVNLQHASKATGKPFEVVLRGDSTLRGHFPVEPEAVEKVLGRRDVWILAPFFLQGGRYTIGDVHYVAENETLMPAAETPFARDATFGYKHSNLRDWVQEKSKGCITRDRVISLDLESLRLKGPEYVRDCLLHAPEGSVAIVNAAAEEDIDVAVLGILGATSQSAKLLFRTAAAFVSSRLGIDPIAPLATEKLQLSPSVGGLIIVGSYVPKTTTQVEKLIKGCGDALTTVLLPVETLLQSHEAAESLITRAIQVAERVLGKPQDVLIMTSRKLIKGNDEEASLNIGTLVAEALVRVVQGINVKPRYIIAKGGITSSDVATKALGIRRATVVGQALSGVPLWRCDENSCKYPGLPFVVFPGNVGNEHALYELVRDWHEIEI